MHTEYKLVSKSLDENCQHSAKFNEHSIHAPRWMIVFSSAYLDTFVHINFYYLQCFAGLIDKSIDKKQSKEEMDTYKKYLQP